MRKKKEMTSWEGVSKWYNKAVGKEGHYFHEKIILPKISSILDIKKNSTASFLDLACGQGILSRHLPSTTEYLGVDISPSLLKSAEEQNKNKNHSFKKADITEPLFLQKKDFNFCTIVLALQNLESPIGAMKNAFHHLERGGKLLLIMNHPCFRIPRQSSWGIDLENKTQYRRVDRYYSSLKIPIQSNPSQGKNSKETLSFHHPLSKWSYWLKEAGFVIEEIEEWCSDKKSTGKYAKMEDTSREEIPMFLTFIAKKL
jgi:ubiquinone/menaquinone biosynthesis C-methylase UbiE